VTQDTPISSANDAERPWSIHHGDCIPWMMEGMEPQSVDLMVTSPPFMQLYAYSNSPNDIGNSEGMDETRIHLGYLYRGLARVLKPGRAAVVHVMQIPRLKRSGQVGLFDFRGLNIRLGERAGLVYEYDWLVRRNPQSQALRTRSRELQFAGLESDRVRSRGCLADYLIKFRAPGNNPEPVESPGEVSRNEWIDWAEAAWFNISETDTLNVRGTKGEDDTRHVCPLQLQTINRLVRLYSNPGELVFDPFGGIGSVAYEAIKLGRRAHLCELKDEYVAAARGNLDRAVALAKAKHAMPLFDMAGAEA
jgi:DNA modification methylase